MEDFSNASGLSDDKLSEGIQTYLDDTFGRKADQQTKAASGENIDSYLKDKFSNSDGPLRHEETVPEMMARLRQKRY